jgi:pimeloyl-ACP methyl ester carboxylesterase
MSQDSFSLDTIQIRIQSKAVERFLTPTAPITTPKDLAFLNSGTRVNLSCGLAVRAWGSGPKVLLVHGWNSLGTHWRKMIQLLIEFGFQAITIDAPAHGESDGRQSDIMSFASELAIAGQELGHLAGVIGHSSGAAAVMIALQSGLEAEAVVLLAPPASLELMVSRWAKLRGVTEADLTLFMLLLERRLETSFQDYNFVESAHNFPMPALIVHDLQDTFFPISDGLAIADAWHGSTFFQTNGYEHLSLMFAEEAITKSVEYLKSMRASGETS